MADIRRIVLTVVVSTALLGFAACSQGGDNAVYQPALAKLIEKAREYKDQGQVETAISRLEAAADIAPDTYQVHYNLGVLYSETSNWEKAARHLEKALEISPDQPNGLYTLGYTYESMGDAFNQAAQAASSSETDSPAPQAPGPSPEEARAKAHDAYQKAISAYQRFLEVAPSSDPGRADVQNQLELLTGKTPTDTP